MRTTTTPVLHQTAYYTQHHWPTSMRSAHMSAGQHALAPASRYERRAALTSAGQHARALASTHERRKMTVKGKQMKLLKFQHLI